MTSGNTMVPTKNSKPKTETKMAKGKASSKSAGKMKIQAGPSGKMAKFVPVKGQKPGVSHNTNAGGGSSYAKGK
jgi:hypothetical protein